MRRAVLLVSLVVAAACGQDDGGSVASGSASGSASASAAPGACRVEGGTDADAEHDLHVTLEEWAIEADAEVGAGVVKVEATNEGAVAHEIVIVRGATPGELTITDEGLDEAALPEGAEVLGEIEPFPKGSSCDGTFELEPGDYSLVCNIVSESEGGAHAAEGMVTGLTVS